MRRWRGRLNHFPLGMGIGESSLAKNSDFSFPVFSIMIKTDLPRHHGALVNVIALGRPIVMRLCTDDDPPYLVPAGETFIELKAQGCEYDLTLTEEQIASLAETDAGILDSAIESNGMPM